MKALSIRQPWAWLIIRPDITSPAERDRAFIEGQMKPVENRTWPTNIRGRVLVHAAKGMTRSEYTDAVEFLREISGPTLPAFEELERGGIVGSVEIIDCVSRSASRYFFGPYGFVLRDAQPLPFLPLRGALGFFDVHDSIGEVVHV